MRKAYRRKRRSCGLCHPNKIGHEPRWRPRELEALRRWEHERGEWLGASRLHADGMSRDVNDERAW